MTFIPLCFGTGPPDNPAELNDHLRAKRPIELPISFGRRLRTPPLPLPSTHAPYIYHAWQFAANDGDETVAVTDTDCGVGFIVKPSSGANKCEVDTCSPRTRPADRTACCVTQATCGDQVRVKGRCANTLVTLLVVVVWGVRSGTTSNCARAGQYNVF